MRNRCSLCLLLIALWTAVTTGLGAELVVALDGSGAFRSIQRAIDAARPGDTILIRPGVYEEVISLRYGLTLRGSGASVTILRSAYGYEPVLQAAGAGTLVVESLSIERATSMLEAVTVDLVSTEAVFRACRISGGQIGGVRATGGSSLVLAQCDVTGNGGYGVHASGGAMVVVHGGRISDNGHVGLHMADARAVIDGGWITSNAWGGLLLEGEASFEAVRTVVETAAGWGVRLTERSTAHWDACSFRSSGDGNIRAVGAAQLTLTGCRMEGGRVAGLLAQGTARIDVEGTHIQHSVGPGVRCEGFAVASLLQSTVSRSGADGIVGSDQSVLTVSRCTVAYNGGDGIVFHGERLLAEQSIFAVNGGVGIRVTRPMSAASAQLMYNNVWGNRAGDYVGVDRPSSDLSTPPEFQDPSSGNLDLSALSECIGAGSFGQSIGAGYDPRWSATAAFGLSLSRANARWGGWELGFGYNAAERVLREISARWEQGGDPLSGGMGVLWTGPRRLRAEGVARVRPAIPVEVSDWEILPAIQVEGILDGATSRWGVFGSVEVTGSSTRMAVTSRIGGPRVLPTHTFSASISGFDVWGQLLRDTVTGLRVGWSGDLTWWGTGDTWQLGLHAVPQFRLQGEVRLAQGEGEITIQGYTYPEEWSTWGSTVSWRQAETQTTVTYGSRRGRFENMEIRVAWSLPGLSIAGMLGASALHGPRIRVDLTATLDEWFTVPLYQTPVPAFVYTPDDPEAGERIRFDSTCSSDPDGVLDQIWWSFGDGNMAVGAVVEHTYAQEGAYDIELIVSDDRGVVSSTQETLVVQPARTRPVASFRWAPVTVGGTRLPRPVRAGDRILLDASGSWDRTGAIAQYQWDLESNGVFDRTSGEPWLTIDPLPVGAWPVTLRVVNEAGFSDVVMYVLSIEPLRPPAARFDLSPSRPAVGDPVRFEDRSVAADGHLVSWEWSFGDGRASRDQEPIHRFDTPGEYLVRLTVRDTEGLSHTAERNVVVQVNPELVQIQDVWALLIGISEYEEVDGLDYARRDAEAVAEWLVEQKVPSENIRLLTDIEDVYTTHSGVSLPMQPATLRNVRESLGWLRRVAGPEDLVIIHFSGHGYQGPALGPDEADGLDEFFVLHDTRVAAKEDTALRDDEFGRFVDRITSNHVLILFDSCYSGGLARSLPSPPPAGRQPDVFTELRMEGRLVLSASTEDQEAFESHDLRHGVFTYFLLEGLRGSADLNGDGHITVWELYGYVRQTVPPFVAAERGRVQVPQMIGSGETRVVLGRTHPDEPPAFSYCPAVPVAGAAVSFRIEGEATLQGGHPSWSFGDGEAEDGEAVSHMYADPGTYNVTLEVISPDGGIRASERKIGVHPAASVVSVSPDGLVLVSAGRQNGVRVADRFRVASTGQEPALLEVLELVDEDRAVCRLLTDTTAVEVGERVDLVATTDAPSCFTTP